MPCSKLLIDAEMELALVKKITDGERVPDETPEESVQVPPTLALAKRKIGETFTPGNGIVALRVALVP